LRDTEVSRILYKAQTKHDQCSTSDTKAVTVDQHETPICIVEAINNRARTDHIRKRVVRVPSGEIGGKKS